jgi:hypothetical protein
LCNGLGPTSLGLLIQVPTLVRVRISFSNLVSEPVFSLLPPSSHSCRPCLAPLLLTHGRHRTPPPGQSRSSPPHPADVCCPLCCRLRGSHRSRVSPRYPALEPLNPRPSELLLVKVAAGVLWLLAAPARCAAVGTCRAPILIVGRRAPARESPVARALAQRAHQ